jgi:hypothetical protein
MGVGTTFLDLARRDYVVVAVTDDGPVGIDTELLTAATTEQQS